MFPEKLPYDHVITHHYIVVSPLASFHANSFLAEEVYIVTTA
jgi:hypothetical protein